MSNYVKVSVPKMEKDAERLRTYMNEIPSFIRDLDGAMKNLGNCWEGPAWAEFQRQVHSDILELLSLYDRLSHDWKAFSEAERIYGDGEQRSCQCVERIRV